MPRSVIASPRRLKMKFRQLDLNAIRVVEVLTALAFCYLAYLASKEPFSTDAGTVLRLSPVIPFAVAFVWLVRGPNNSQWLTIRAIHQAMSLVSLGCAGILLVGLPDTAIACAYLALVGAIQLAALLAIRRVAADLPATSGWHRSLRIGMVFFLSVVYLSFK